MANTRVAQPKTLGIQSGNPNAQNAGSVFQKVSTGKVSSPIKQPTWPRSGTETMGQMARLLRGKLPR